MRWTIRTKLLTAICIPLFAVYLLVLGLDYRTGRARALANMRDRLTELAAGHAARLDGEFDALAQVARSTAEFLGTEGERREEQLYAILRANVEGKARVFGSCIAFQPGAFAPEIERFAPYVCRSEDGLRELDIGHEGYDYLRSDWYLIPRLLDETVWSAPYYDEGAGNILMCTFSAPFRRGERLAGITTVDISLEDLHHRVASVQLEGGHCMILGPNGRFISHPDRSFVMRETIFSVAEWYNAPKLAEVGRAMKAQDAGVWRMPDYKTGKPEWLIGAPIPSTGWSFLAVVPEDRVLAPVRAELARKVGLMLGGLALISGIVLLLTVEITQPIGRLARAVHRIATGDLDVRTAEKGSDEIGEFSRTLDKMVLDLKDHIEALKRETAAREAVEGELRIGRQIQTSLLPRTFPPFPNRTEFALHAVNLPARQVAGDFFDFFFLSEDVLAVLIADVSGKGVPASLFMAVTRTLVRNLAGKGLTPAGLLERVNDALAEDNPECMFVTVFFAHYETATGRLLYANAGHNPPYVLETTGGVHAFPIGSGPVLGALPHRHYTDGELTLQVGEALVLYTDGVTEAESRDGKMFGEAGLEALLARCAGKPADRICTTIAETAQDYQEHKLADDVTVLVLRRETEGRA